jgi:hypothetical protein
MSFLDKVAAVVGYIKKAVDWFSNPENQETVREAAQFILTIVQVVASLNEPIPKRDRPKLVRTVVEIMQMLSPSDLRGLAEIKERTDFDQWTSGQLDARIGTILGGYIDEKTEKEKKGKTS